MKKIAFCLGMFVFAFAPVARPCLVRIPDIDQYGPGTWNRADDVPANWVFAYRHVESGGFSWWQRQLPDGEPSRLVIETSDSMVRVFPSQPAEVGQEYEVFSAYGDVDLSPATALDRKSTSVVFTIRDEDHIPPDRLTATSASVRDIVRLPTDFLFEDSCAPQPGPSYGYAEIAVIVSPDSSAVLLRDASTDTVIDAVLLGPSDTNAIVRSRRVQTSTVLDYQVEVYDYAGNVTAETGTIVIDRPVSCRSTAVDTKRTKVPAFAMLALGVFVFFRRRQRTRA